MIKHLKKVVRLCSVEVYKTLHGNSLLSWVFHLGHKELEESFVAVFYGRGLLLPLCLSDKQ